MGPRFRGDDITAGATSLDRLLLIEQRNALVVGRLGDRLQVGVDVGEVLVREDRLHVGRHGAIGGAHERRERLDRHGIGRELRPGDAALRLEAVAGPAAVLDVRGLALLGRGGQCSAAAENEAGGERHQLTHTNETHGPASYRGWVQTLTSAGWPDFTAATACLMAGPSSAGSLIGPFAHQPIDSASL